MNDPYWKWDKKIPAELCETLLSEIRMLPTGEGTTLGSNIKNGEKIRTNSTVFLEKNHWIEGILYRHIMYANESAAWNFDVNNCLQTQIALYKPGQYYNWHDDEGIHIKNQYSLEDMLFKQRKISAVCQLSKSCDFSGGGLLLENIEGSVLQEQGDIVVFPAYLQHKALTVDSGERITAVCWAIGNYWK